MSTRHPLEEAWRRTAADAGLSEPDAAAVFQDLSRRYSEPGRAYHNLEHVAAMLETVSAFGDALHDDTAICLAVWFHDANYDARRPDNEERSAVLAAAALGRGGASPALVSAVGRLILATKTHRAAPDDTDCQILLDADLAVLGSGAASYDRYARAIREEYAWVPEADWRAGRRRVLEGFLGRDRLYHTAALFQRCEQAARANLRREIECLTTSNSL